MGAGFGKDKILMIRKLGDNANAARLALQIEHKLEYSRKADSVATKDGSVTTSNGLETTLTLKAVSSRSKVDKLLEDAVINDDVLEFWEVDLKGEKQGNKYPAKYMRGTLSSWEVPANVEDLIEQEAEATIIGKPVDGYATITTEQESAIQYAFTDVTEAPQA